MTITIEIIQEDIDNGIPTSPISCPVALAFRRMGYDSISVGLGYADFFDKDGCLVYLNGDKAANDFIRKFDCGELVKPIVVTFTEE